MKKICILRLLLFISIIFTVVMDSCSSDKKDSSIINTLYTIDYDHDNSSLKIPTLVDSVEFIPLYGSIEDPISHVDELQVTDNGIYILDRRRAKLHVYDAKGNRAFALDAKGHSKQEYLEIACFAITDSSIYIVDNFGQKINEYDLVDGMFKNSCQAQIVIGAIRPLQNGNFLLAELPMEGVNQLEGSNGNRLYIVDNSFRIKSSFYPYNNVRDKIGMGRFLTDNDSVIIYSSTGYNGFSLLSAKNGNFIGNVSLKTTRPYNNSEIIRMDLSNALNYIEKENWQFLTTTPLVAEKYISLSVKEGETAEPAIYDTNSHKLFFNDETSMYNSLIEPDAAHGGCFYVLYNYGGDFLDEQLQMGFNQPPHDADSITRNDGAILLRYKMKS